jgi:hypothetical protein
MRYICLVVTLLVIVVLVSGCAYNGPKADFSDMAWYWPGHPLREVNCNVLGRAHLRPCIEEQCVREFPSVYSFVDISSEAHTCIEQRTHRR